MRFGLQTLRVRRILDEARQTLLYVAYSTRLSTTNVSALTLALHHIAARGSGICNLATMHTTLPTLQGIAGEALLL